MRKPTSGSIRGRIFVDGMFEANTPADWQAPTDTAAHSVIAAAAETVDDDRPPMAGLQRIGARSFKTTP